MIERVQMKNERLRVLYALAGAINDATDDYCITIWLSKFDTVVHITDLTGPEPTGIRYMFYTNDTYEWTDPDERQDDEDMTGAEAALLDLLERVRHDRQSEVV